MTRGPATIDTPDARNRDNYSITDLAAEFGVTARALRFYEDEGLIAPERIGLARVYSKRDRARLAWILRGKRVGFSLAEIREMIDLYDVGDNRHAQRLVLLRGPVPALLFGLLPRDRFPVQVLLLNRLEQLPA